MINVAILSKNKPGGTAQASGSSSFRQVSSNGGGGGASFSPRVLWGQRFDGTADVYGDMEIRGRIDGVTGLAVSGSAAISKSLTVDGSMYRAGYDVFDRGNSGLGHGWVQLYPDREYFLSTNQYGEVTDPVRFLETVRADGNIRTPRIDASWGYFDNIRATEITTDYLTVTKKAHFFSLVIDEVKAVGGQLIVTAASAKIDLVEKISGGWRCYFRAEDPDGNKNHNEFCRDDQIICQTFNAAAGTSYNVSNTYWWRLCTGVSSRPVPKVIDGRTYDCHWFDVSETDCDDRSDPPSPGDAAVLLGNRTDTDRQDAIIISAYRQQYLDPEIIAPSFCQYAGINSYNIASKRLTWFSKSGNTVRGTLVVENGMTVEDYITSIIGDTSLDPDNPNSGKYVHMAWANGPTDWTKDASRSDEDWTYLGICADDNETDAGLSYYSYRWTRIKGSSVTGIREYYMRTEQGVETPLHSDTRWVLNNPPELTETYRWLWNYEEFVFTDTVIRTDPRVIGVFGSGKGISSVENFYMTTAAATGVTVLDEGWSHDAEPPSVNRPYLWNYEIIHWTDGTQSVIEPHIISVFSDVADISIGFERSYRMIDAGSYAVISPDDTLHLRVAFDLVCISGTQTVRVRPSDSLYPSGSVSASFQTYAGGSSTDQMTRPSGTLSGPPSSNSYTWVYDTSVPGYSNDSSYSPYASHITVRLTVDGAVSDSFGIPVVLEPGSYFSTLDGLFSRVQDTDTSLAALDASVKTVHNQYSQIRQDVSSISGRVSDISTRVDRATEMVTDVSGYVTDVSIYAHGLETRVEGFQEWFDENGDLVDYSQQISGISQRCDSIESTVLDISNGLTEASSRITQTAGSITSVVTDVSALKTRDSSLQTQISQISQTAEAINLRVMEATNKADSLDASLTYTGIDIQSGKISLKGASTEIIGNLSVIAGDGGFQVYNGDRTKSVQIMNDSIGKLNSYSMSGWIEKSVTKTDNKAAGTSFEVKFPKLSLGYIQSGSTVTAKTGPLTLNGSTLNFTDFGPDRTVTKVDWTVKVVNSGNTVRKTESASVNTPVDITRSYEGITGPPVTYKTTATETLYIEATCTVTVTQALSQAGQYTATLILSTYAAMTSLNKIAIDGAVMSKSSQEYLWAGLHSMPDRSGDDYGIVARNKQHGLAVTPLGLFRPFCSLRFATDGYPDDWGRWGEASSTIPVQTVDVNTTYTATLRDALIVFNKKDDSGCTLYLPNPYTCPGKWYIVKRVSASGGSVRIMCTGATVGSMCIIKAGDSGPCGNTLDYTEGIRMMMSDGTYWIELWGAT